ncbi:MAG: GNAT family N-acetyltransferase [Chloroflexota bacterium]|nr:GNAT family N-acetyltransferase [Chloroflexota bacterium]
MADALITPTIAPLRSARLILMPCPPQVANSAYGGLRQLESLVGARFATDWLDNDGRSLLGYYAHQINHDPTLLGWGLWLIQHAEDRIVIGSAGFKGKPDETGMIEIGYGISQSYRRQGYTFEAARALVDWAFARPDVRRLTAEALYHNVASLRILEKLGMTRTGRMGDYIKWELKNNAK